MMYFGGKARIAKQLSAYLNSQITEHYYEPFVGSAWVYQYIQAEKKFASDAHPDLILLWEAIMDGWQPPTEVSEDMYQEVRQLEPCALRGFIGFGCSFGGKWFGGYARNKKGTNYAGAAVRSLESKRERISHGHYCFERRGYLDVKPTSRTDVIYCDPPYADTTNFSTGTFNHQDFWHWVRDMGQFCKVYVSEYTAPDWAKVVLEIDTNTSMRDTENHRIHRTERLYTI